MLSFRNTKGVDCSRRKILNKIQEFPHPSFRVKISYQALKSFTNLSQKVKLVFFSTPFEWKIFNIFFYTTYSWNGKNHNPLHWMSHINTVATLHAVLITPGKKRRKERDIMLHNITIKIIFWWVKMSQRRAIIAMIIEII